MTTPTLTVGLPSFGAPPGKSWRDLIELARIAEGVGVDRVIVSDHVVLGPNTHTYPWGRFPTAADAPWLEPLTVLAAVAAATSSIRLATGILIAPLRPAAVLAKTVATLDQLSDGRLDLGVGTGWQREEYAAVGVDFAQRGRLLTETMTTCRAFWEGRVPDIHCEPRPVQNPLPVWFSGMLHDRNVARIVELGDGWIPIMGSRAEDVRRGAARLREAFLAHGRRPESLRVQATANAMDAVPGLVEAGATTISMFLRRMTEDMSEAPELLSRLVKDFSTTTR
jgi:probable F420-dependent oxidoreductase